MAFQVVIKQTEISKISIWHTWGSSFQKWGGQYFEPLKTSVNNNNNNNNNTKVILP